MNDTRSQGKGNLMVLFNVTKVEKSQNNENTNNGYMSAKIITEGDNNLSYSDDSDGKLLNKFYGNQQ